MAAKTNQLGTSRVTEEAAERAAPDDAVHDDSGVLPEEVRRFALLSPGEKIRVGERWKKELLTLRGLR